MAEETPQLPQEEEVAQEKPQGAEMDTEALLETLEKLDIQSPERLENLAETGRAYHTASQRLGERNQEVEQLRQEVQLLRQQQGTRQPPSQQEDWSYGEPTQQIDLRSEIKHAVREVYQDEILKPQMETNRRFLEELNWIQSSEHYPLVEDDWKTHYNNPQVQLRISQGQTTAGQEFSNLVMSKYRNIALQARDVVKNRLQGVAPESTEPPHMESEGATPPSQEKPDDRADRIQKALEGWQGDDKDVDRLLEVMLPDDDPLLQYGVERAAPPRGPTRRK